jgi:hypothetical protein
MGLKLMKKPTAQGSKGSFNTTSGNGSSNAHKPVRELEVTMEFETFSSSELWEWLTRANRTVGESF